MVNPERRRAKAEAGSRAAILDAAMAAFKEAGFAGARVDDIALKAAANKAMIYYHFGSKQGLYRAVLLQLFGNVLGEVERLRESGEPPAARLRALYVRIAAHFHEKPALPHIMLREILAGGKSMDADVAHTLFSIVAFVADTIKDGVRRGEFRSVNPVLLHMSILTPLMLHFAGTSFRERLLAREMPALLPPSPDDMLTHLLGVLDRALMAAPGPKLPSRKRKTTK